MSSNITWNIENEFCKNEPHLRIACTIDQRRIIKDWTSSEGCRVTEFEPYSEDLFTIEKAFCKNNIYLTMTYIVGSGGVIGQHAIITESIFRVDTELMRFNFTQSIYLISENVIMKNNMYWRIERKSRSGGIINQRIVLIESTSLKKCGSCEIKPQLKNRFYCWKHIL